MVTKRRKKQWADDAYKLGVFLILLLIAVEVFHLEQKVSSITPLYDATAAVSEAILDDVTALKAGASDPNSATAIRVAERRFDAYVADLRESEVRMYWRNSKGQNIGDLANLIQHLRSRGRMVYFATNAGIFGEDYAPLGLYVENGKELIPVNRDTMSPGNFFMQPNGIFAIYDSSAEINLTQSFKPRESLRYATQSGPMLVSKGRINQRFDKRSPNRLIRSGVGIIDKHTIVFIISRDSVTFYEFARVFRHKYRCRNALYLDGVISESYVPRLWRRQLSQSFAAMIAVSDREGLQTE